MPAFELWLEFEHWVANEQDNPYNDFFNMHVILPDGKKPIIYSKLVHGINCY